MATSELASMRENTHMLRTVKPKVPGKIALFLLVSGCLPAR
ncbi:MAG: hypothetical protein ACUBOA_09685 [Candidatus Loosdrechtia sp.]|nr:MAG: hypothetical protein QY305_11395 [Candidatus Jettenia sp. AMX2]